MVARELLDRVESDHTDAWIELDMGAHTHRAMGDTTFQRAFAARVNVLDGEVAFGRRGFLDSFRDRALFNAAAVEDTGLVEMNMRLDQAGDDQAASSIQFWGTHFESRRNSDDGGALEADIDGTQLTCQQNAGATNDQVHQFTAGRAPR